MKSLMKKYLIALSIVSLLSLFFLLNKKTSHSVVIHAPLETVWNYASDSTKAEDWSIYFDHISPLAGVEDGKVGSIRRCFRRKDETGPIWDELVLTVTPLKYRRIKTYNLQNFKNPHLKKAEFLVEQFYQKLSEKKTKLTFSTYFLGPFHIDVIRALLPAGGETKRIFKANLENIKAAIEMGDDYQPLHQYEEKNNFDGI
jgi:hypothetical protein